MSEESKNIHNGAPVLNCYLNNNHKMMSNVPQTTSDESDEFDEMDGPLSSTSFKDSKKNDDSNKSKLDELNKLSIAEIDSFILRLTELKVLKQQQEQEGGEQEGGEQLNFNNIKQNAHLEVSKYIINDIAEYENNTVSDTDVFLQNINKNINNKLEGGNIELNSNVSTERFLDYIEDKLNNNLNNNLNGGDINNILQDSFIKGMNKGGYLDNDTITQQDILNGIRMYGGKKNESETESDEDSDNEDSDNEESELESELESESESDSDKLKFNTKRSSDKRGQNKYDSSSDSSSDSNSDSNSDSDDESESSSGKNNYTTGPSVKRGKKTENYKYNSDSDSDSLSSIIVTSEDKSVTPYMVSSSSLQTDDINLISFSPKHTTKKSSKKSTKKSSKKSSKK
jgi:hypothetical protein